jgi:pSer/pThr/pTyr-binding forkhead associated (FHA) protein
VNDPLIARFAEACGATRPLHLRVGTADGGVLADGNVDQPFTLLGRDDACDVTLNDPEVNPRHAWFQVVGGRVYAMDLGSRAGIHWPDGKRRSGWIEAGSPVRVGPFKIQLRSPVSDQRGSPGPDPLNANRNLSRAQPCVQLDFRNGKRAKDRWIVNRGVTLVGRSDSCKLHLHADDISMYHCGLVLTPSGLWVVDLSGRGVVVNGERMRVAPLAHGAELWIGRFLIGCHYATPDEAASAGRASKSGLPLRVSATGQPTRPIKVNPVVAEDEVPLGGLPALDPSSGLPNSHIMCDAFQSPAASGPISAPIFVTGSSPTPPPVPASTLNRTVPAPAQPAISLPITDESVAPLLKQLSELHGQMLEQFQHSLLLMTKLFNRVPAADSSVLHQELTRIQDLNAELGKLQSEVTRHSLAQVAENQRPTASDPTPLQGAPPLRSPARHSDADGAIQEYVEERIGALQKERRNRWEKLNGIVTGSSTEHEPLR